MTFLEILEAIFLGPLKLIFEVIFELANRIAGHPGIAIIFLSLAINLLVLPLYRRADAMQMESRDIEAKLQKGVAHIKKTFKGDEKMMMLATYYRQNNYKPTDALNGSVSLLLEIPFFMAAYQFLSSLTLLKGVSLGPITDLSKPDTLIVIGSLNINILPILMTVINFISSAIYLKGFPLKTKIQLYGMAIFFLIFLYPSPSGLVFYWTLNNLFSLIKTIAYKLIRANKKKRNEEKQGIKESPDRKLFLLGCITLTLFIGVFIPLTFIADSPQEFVDITYFHHPLWYVLNSVCLSGGTFLVWFNVFYWIANKRYKIIFEKAVWILCGIAITNYMFFGTRLGVISASLQYEQGLNFTNFEKLINIFAISALAVLLYFVITKWKKAVSLILVTSIIALSGIAAVNTVKTYNSVKELNSAEQAVKDNIPIMEFSQKGKNVLIIMLDRAMGQYVPYLFNEKPELKEKFSGFTYYANTVSFGGYTNLAAPALFGGYEYTPVEMNKRDNEYLQKKHNEALKVMPKLFSDNGYNVTFCDPVYANYQWVPDLSVFERINMNAFITNGLFNDVSNKQSLISSNHRNFFCFSVMKSLPLALQPTVYNNGNYLKLESDNTDAVYNNQTIHSLSTATGYFSYFMKYYNTLANYSNLTRITKKDINTFSIITNSVTHEPMLLDEPSYTPQYQVNNIAYDAANIGRFTVNGKTLKVINSNQMKHYQTNMAAFIQLGKWFDYMRENGVYDNTRIILVSDHGRYLGHFEELVMDSSIPEMDLETYYPLLMVKDFGSTKFTTDESFMTNADVIMLATNGLIESPVNPFTNKPITDSEKYAHDQFICLSNEWDTNKNNGRTFKPSRWASVNKDMRNPKNWKIYDEITVLKEHTAP